METIKGPAKVLLEPELVLRGKALEQMGTKETDGVVVCVLWGKYEEYGNSYEGFGLQLEGKEGVLKRIPDLSTDAAKICNLAERMNRCKVSRYHFDDVVADFLAAV